VKRYICTVQVGSSVGRAPAEGISELLRAYETRPDRPESPPDGFASVNVCSGEPHTVGELAWLLAAAMGGPAPVARGRRTSGVVAAPHRAAELLGHRAAVGFASGVAAVATDPLREPASVTTRSTTDG
jgi:dTDP-L-rhamnose 4-epimerase